MLSEKADNQEYKRAFVDRQSRWVDFKIWRLCQEVKDAATALMKIQVEVGHLKEWLEKWTQYQGTLLTEGFDDDPLFLGNIPNLTTRTENALRSSGIITLHEIWIKSPEELTSLRNLGRKSRFEIYAIMEGMGLTMKRWHEIHAAEMSSEIKRFLDNQKSKKADIVDG